MTEKIKVDADLVGALYCGGIEGGWSWAANEQGDDRRWSRTVTLVLRRDSDLTFWGIEYEEGLTEYQDDEYPWEEVEEPGTVELFRVYPHSVTITEYRITPAK